MTLNPEEHIIDNHIYRKDDSVIYVSEEDVIRLFSPHSNTMTELLGSGSEVWSHIDGEKSVEDIIAILSDIYEVDIEVLEGDIKEFIGELVKRRMCKRVK